MFAVREGVVKVHEVMVPTYSRNVRSGDESFVVEAGVGPYRKNDCQLSFLSLFSSTRGIFNSLIRDKDGWNGGLELTVYGEDALDGLIASLEFALAALRDARTGVRD